MSDIILKFYRLADFKTGSVSLDFRPIVLLDFSEDATFPEGTVTLDFSSTEPPPPPPPAKLPPWTMTGIAWNTELVGRRESQTAITKHYYRVGIEFIIANNSMNRVAQTIELLDFATRIDSTTALAWSPMMPSTGNTVTLNWITPASYTTELVMTWQGSLPLMMIENAIHWSSNLILHEEVTQIPYTSLTTRFDSYTDVVWRSGADGRDTEYGIVWGPHAPRLICSSDYRPQRGTVSLLFKDDAVFTTGTVTLNFIPEPLFCYYDDGGGLIDGGIDLPNIDFDIPIEPQIRRVYLMQPELIVTRVFDGEPIIVTSVSISNSRGNFTGSVNMEFGCKGDADNAINQLLLVQINGYEFYAKIEQLSRQRSFNRLQYSGTGRTRTSDIASPWRLPISYSNTVNRSFAGMMGDILTGSGWSVELVGFNDFNVNAGVFSISGKAPVESVADMADMIGCMVVEDEPNSKLKILPRWPVVPWAMDSATPAIVLHDAVILSHNGQEEINQLCNACWVRGENQGVSRRVRRAGTAGNIPTEDVSASLIVSDIPAQLLGTSKIVDTGRKERITVTLPVMGDLPPLVKGMLIGVAYFGEVYKAICDSTTISAIVDNRGSIDVTQSATLIRHLEVPT